MITEETRREANETVDKSIRYQQIRKILSWIGSGTAKEIAVAMNQNGWTPTPERNFSAPRLTEMEEKGIVEIVGKKHCGYTGKLVAVYRLTN